MLDLEPIKTRAGIGAPTPEHDCSNQSNGCERCEREAQDSAADVPALVAEVEAERAENRRLRAALEGAERNGSSWLNECDRRGKEIAALSMDNLTLRAALAAEREACDEWRENQHMHYKGIFGEAPCHDGACPLCVKHDARRAAEQGKL